MSTSEQDKWDSLYRTAERGAPARVLEENVHLLPVQGRALEVACGLGANAIRLAQHGLEVEAWDTSAVAVERVRRYGTEQGLALRGEVRDVLRHPPPADCYDVIVVTHFLDRELMPLLIEALRADGLLFFQTFTHRRCDDTGPRNPAYRLYDNELLHLCGGLRIVVYREEGVVGDTTQGFRNQAYLVGQKR